MNEARAKTKLQAASDKQQATEATSSKLQAQPEVASDKHQAASEESHKPQASSDKQQASGDLNPSLTSAKILVPGNSLQEA